MRESIIHKLCKPVKPEFRDCTDEELARFLKDPSNCTNPILNKVNASSDDNTTTTEDEDKD